MASHPPKRVRTGCLKCRARRRKCTSRAEKRGCAASPHAGVKGTDQDYAGDEGKPQCQRCIAGGFECQYGTRLSFLQKNAITARAEQAAGPSAAYRRVQVRLSPYSWLLGARNR